MNQSGFGNLRWLGLSLAIIALDQWTKHLVVQSFSLYESVKVLPYFNLTYVHNTGAAFSFLHDAGGWQRWLFALIAISISMGLVLWLKRMPPGHRSNAVAVALIIGGALGNLYDRLMYGYVVDFLDVYGAIFRPFLGGEHFPAFNVADSAICVGAFLLLVDSFRKKPDEESNASLQKS